MTDAHRAEFLRRLTAHHDDFLVWKHLDRALTGVGDVDSAAPASAADAISEDAAAMAASVLGAVAVVDCRHVADKRLQFFVLPHALPQLFELDVCTRPSRGLTPWADPARMRELAVLSSHGIRRLRPGAEALVSIVYHGISPNGGARLSGDEQEIVSTGLAHDANGAYAACTSLSPVLARSSLLRLLDVARQGGWDDDLSRRAFWGFVASGVVHPQFSTRRAVFRLRIAVNRDCVMHRFAQKQHRRVEPHQVPALLTAAERDGHRVSRL